MHATPDAPIADLAATWEEIRAEYYAGHDTDAVLACAHALAADPGGERAWLWTLGLLMTADYVALQPASDGTAATVLDALRATDRTLRERPCTHETHPYEGDLNDELECLVSYLPLLGNGTPSGDDTDWTALAVESKEEWRCPRNVAGYARVAVDILAPGTTDGIPARLSTADQEEIQDLAALLHGCATPGVSVSWTLSHYGAALAAARADAERAGLVVIVSALSWYAAAGLVTSPGPIDDLIAGLASVRAAAREARCAHGESGHPVLGNDPEDVITAGMRLKSPGGRRLHEERRAASGTGAPLDAWLCPVFVAGLARESLDRLRAARALQFGPLRAGR
ncbi:hypothetical protein ACTPOK_10845 [Streptomyces inhibens]|uniref:hypothetical protein n=1 Tax=Streptomyces inhibens TaxID=2293571 RepID=UPI00402AA494